MTNYASVASVRRSCGNILDTEFADVDVTEEMDAADSWINTTTQKSDWDSGDVQYKLIVKLSKKKATEFVLEQYGDEFQGKVKDLREECDKLMADIKNNMPADEGGTIDSNIIIVTSNYESYPLNRQDDTNASPFISTEESALI